jgi:hypothetical protein
MSTAETVMSSVDGVFSVFSDVNTEMSSADEGPSITLQAWTSATDSLASLLIENDELRSSCVGAIRHGDIGSFQLETNLSQLLMQCFETLSEEDMEPAQLGAVRFFQSRSRLQRVSNKMWQIVKADSGNLPVVREGLGPRANIQRSYDNLLSAGKGKEVHAESRSSDKDDDGSDEEDAGIPELAEFNFHVLVAFIFNSRAFHLLKRNLHDFVSPNKLLNFSGILDNISQQITRRTIETSDKHTALLQSVLIQLRSVEPASISISNLHASTIDNWKLKMEALSGNSWNWWPLQEPIYPIPPGHVCLQWQCVSLRWTVPLSHFTLLTHSRGAVLDVELMSRSGLVKG